MMKSIGPVEAAIKPGLRFSRIRRDFSAVGAKIKGVVHRDSFQART